MENLALQDFKVCQEMMVKLVLKVQKDIEVYLGFKGYLVPLVLLGTKDQLETMEITENPESKDLEGHLVWMETLDLQGFQVLLAQEDPREKKENGVLEEKEVHLDLLVLLVKEWVSTWLL